MKLYRTKDGIVVDDGGSWASLPSVDWNELFAQDDLAAFVRARIAGASGGGRAAATPSAPAPSPADLLPLVDRQEVWAAGVTYYRSRDARMHESQQSGGDTFYDKVYAADRPELFYKGSKRTVVAHGGDVRIRVDATWNVPEPELALVTNSRGRIIGYTVGNDMSSRDIEGANPLYLPQAKVYDASCALGPCILVGSDPLPKTTAIRLQILRGESTAFAGDTTLAELKRDPQELVDYLYRDNPFPDGAVLLTGTGIIPGNDFTLQPGDRVEIEIDGIGTLTNRVVQGAR
ncbi:MAG: 2-hydroxyhepta-2,4-diene-1,7-dioate isomerase [Spirochaetaceae bacterium]|nr:MAG: 2-hydroxyhepta-2,4-diene-1,7-dioate isomerase [Spirochaetaceae bacterium]